MAQLNIKIEGLDEFKKNLSKAPELASQKISDSIKKAGIMVQALEKREAPAKTGYLRKSIDVDIRSLKATITPTAEYAKYLVAGTKAHGTVRAKALAFKIGGKMIFTRRVAGIKKNDFVGRAYKYSISPVTKLFEKTIKEFLTAITK